MSRENNNMGSQLNNNYGGLNQYYQEISTPPEWRISNRSGFVASDLKYMTQKNKNIMVNSNGISGYDSLVKGIDKNALATTGSTNYGYPNLKTTEELLRSMDQSIQFNSGAITDSVRFTNGSQKYHTFQNY